MMGCPGYILSRNVVQFLKERRELDLLYLYKNEDTAVGIWLNQNPSYSKNVKYIDVLSPCYKDLVDSYPKCKKENQDSFVGKLEVGFLSI